eukprot:1173575-Rhodomonas_salina.1
MNRAKKVAFPSAKLCFQACRSPLDLQIYALMQAEICTCRSRIQPTATRLQPFLDLTSGMRSHQVALQNTNGTPELGPVRSRHRHDLRARVPRRCSASCNIDDADGGRLRGSEACVAGRQSGHSLCQRRGREALRDDGGRFPPFAPLPTAVCVPGCWMFFAHLFSSWGLLESDEVAL